jgi:hypothetical protein
MTECVVAEFRTRPDAKLALEVLMRNHYTRENVSVVMRADDPTAENLDEFRDEEGISAADVEVNAPDGRSVGLGMLLGGAVSAPLAIGTMIGPFIIAGPIVGMGIGAALGALFGSLEQDDTAEDEPSYEDRVKAGSILVIVTQDEMIGLNEAEAVLATTNPKTMERFELDLSER